MRKKKWLALLLLLALLGSGVSAQAAEESGGFDPSLFAGKRVGVMAGGIYAQLGPELLEDAEIYYFSTTTDIVAALTAGKLDAMMEDRTSLQYTASQVSGYRVEMIEGTENPIAFIAPKTEEGAALVAELDEWIIGIRSSGELERLEEKWLRGTNEDRVMEISTTLPAINGTLSVATDPQFPPMEYMKGSDFVGYEIELIATFCKEKGYALDINSSTFSGALAGVTAGKYDLGVSDFSVTEERKQSVLFTEPVLINASAVMFPDDLAGGEKTGFWQKCKDGFEKTFITDNRWELFRDGLLVTLRITLLSALFGTALGFALYLACRGGKKLPVYISRFCRWLIKGMPEVVFLMILFYIVFRGSPISGEWTGIVGFTLLFACTVHEILQSAELALPAGQALAAKALGYTELQSFFHILFPQMLPFALPAYRSELSTHVKATAIVGYIAVVDLTKVSDIVRGITYDPFFSLIAVAILYFLLAGVLQLGVKLLMRQCDPRRRSEAQVLKGLVIR